MSEMTVYHTNVDSNKCVCVSKKRLCEAGFNDGDVIGLYVNKHFPNDVIDIIKYKKDHNNKRLIAKKVVAKNQSVKFTFVTSHVGESVSIIVEKENIRVSRI